VPDSLALYRRAFIELNTSRPMGMSGSGPIPWMAVHEWARRHGIDDPDDFDDLWALVQAQDQTYLSHQQGDNSVQVKSDGS